MRESLRRLASEEGMDRKVGNIRRVRVELLDGDHITLDLDRKSRGEDLLDRVCESLDVVERDYFGLLHTQRGDPRVWVDLNRRLSKTFRNEPWDVKFAVRFYPPEPSELQDEHARYQVALAVRRDLVEGRLTCSSITYALLASYVLQAELGDLEGRVSAALVARHRAAPLAALTPDLEGRVSAALVARHRAAPLAALTPDLEGRVSAALVARHRAAPLAALTPDLEGRVSAALVARHRAAPLAALTPDLEGRVSAALVARHRAAPLAALTPDLEGRVSAALVARHRAAPLAALTPDLEGRVSAALVARHRAAPLAALTPDLEGRVSAALVARHRAAPLAALTPDLETKLEDLYRKHKGQSPAQAELNYLENAKRLAMYGAELHSVQDSDNVDISLAICANSISVYRDGLIMNRFPWTMITKICYNKRAFTLRLRASECDQFEKYLTFRLPSTRACKKLWRCSVEHHIFFRRGSPVCVGPSCRRTLRQLRDPGDD